ncbi:hypothetical protein [Actinocrinis sp.]|uniref:hypothetical protein n=1 Tax=Actinocrinis sp. TaxID=1920516 RepID=UPI002D32A0E6|nr:hypothetical protein [Actinocrinis sp.]HZP50866.1 hypothetical protein [Actinocrinis sp.]
MERWSLSLSRVTGPLHARTVPGLRRPEERPADPERLLSGNPVLLLAGPRTAASIEALVRTWNPTPTRDEHDVLHVADGVRWHGPFRLDPTLAAQAELPGGWSTGYVAEAPRRRVRIPDGRNAEALRRRYPRDIPTGPEALAWSLVTGLARLLGGAARLPGCPPYVAEPHETVYCVYGHEALPWQVLRSVLGLAIPDLGRNGALAANDYSLDRPGALEIRVQPFGADEFLPYALRSRADDGWPHTVYRFSCVKQATAVETASLIERVRNAAVLLAEVIGGVLLDEDGFPVGA